MIFLGISAFFVGFLFSTRLSEKSIEKGEQTTQEKKYYVTVNIPGLKENFVDPSIGYSSKTKQYFYYILDKDGIINRIGIEKNDFDKIETISSDTYIQERTVITNIVHTEYLDEYKYDTIEESFYELYYNPNQLYEINE